MVAKSYISGSHFRAGEIIVEQGTAGDKAYIIESGKVEILIEKPDGSVESVGTRGPGTIVGEMAIIDNGPRIATVRALEDCSLQEISREDFARRLAGADPIIQMVTQVVLIRCRDLLARRSETSADWPPPESIERGHAAQAAILESVRLANDFKAALDRGELSLHYQPVIDLKRGAVVGFEALMRWNHPVQGAISPAEFIPVAERTGLIVPAAQWAAREACAALRRICEATQPEKLPFVTVNFSNRDFSQPNILDFLLAAIGDAGLQPYQFKIEITERIIIEEPDRTKAALELCRDAGIGVAIDDFGTGYSSLNYLHYFPIETLKIDQSFISIMNREFKTQNLVNSIIRLGKSLDMTVVAEGVETGEQARLLREMGCDIAQGFYFANPMPEADIISMLTAAGPMWRIAA